MSRFMEDHLAVEPSDRTDPPTPPWDVIVLGAGAAGLCAAIRGAEAGARVLLLEKNRRPGVKILISGGTRCNLTNARGLRNLRVVSGPVDPAYDPREARGARSIQDAFGDGGAFLGPALRAFSVERTVELFEAEGVATKVEANGKIFPVSDRAVDVLDALVRRLGRSGAVLRVSSPVQALDPIAEGFRVTTPDGVETARRVILAVGGQSYPGCGTSGDGYAIARALGHTIVEPRPDLVPIRVVPRWVAALRGMTLPDVSLSVLDGTGRVLSQRREALLFAHFGLTGPAVLDVSRAVARPENGGALRLAVDLFPEASAEHIERRVLEDSRTGRRSVTQLLPEALPRRLREAIVETAGIPPSRCGPELSREERKRLVQAVKALTLPIEGTLGFEKAEVTSGGVLLDEVNPKSLESTLQPGLHFAGEVLDLDGRIGGYNFQGAWSTGWLAGESAALVS
ncbi:MAG: NAD(P)/FAD-dependent oxidoreductase [Isosphaeraceae bacterium]